MPPVTTALIVANVALFLLQSVIPGLVVPFALWPLATASLGQGVSFMPWQVVTYAFLHGSFEHLFFNMLGLWMFGSELERIWGEKRFLQFYAASVLAAALAQLVVTAVMGSVYPTVGASGGLFGLLFAFAVMFPNRVILLFFVIPMKARYLVALYGLLELYQGVYVMNSGVAHFAHLGGMVGGFLMIRYWRGQAPFGRR